MTTYEAIFKRSAVREYRDQLLSEREKNEISRRINNLNSLISNPRIKFLIMEHNDFVKRFRGKIVKSPYYIIISAERKARYLENAGYMGEQLVLELTTLGLGTCWLGSVKPTKNALADIQNEYCITIAFGFPYDDEAFINDTPEFDRLPIDKVLLGARPYGDDLKLIEAARLAPSGTNLQPCRFAAGDNVIHVYRKNSFKFKSKQVELMESIDTGIALAHIDIAIANKKNHKAVFASKKTHSIDKMKYVISVS